MHWVLIISHALGAQGSEIASYKTEAACNEAQNKIHAVQIKVVMPENFLGSFGLITKCQKKND